MFLIYQITPYRRGVQFLTTLITDAHHVVRYTIHPC